MTVSPKGVGFGRTRSPEADARYEARQRKALKAEAAKRRRDARRARVLTKTRPPTLDNLTNPKQSK